MNIIKSLKNLGLNEKEAKVYTSLLQLGTATAYAVSKHSGLKKSTTYVVLEDLIDKGIATKIPRSKIFKYTVISPEDLFAFTRSKLETAKESLPELKAMSRGRMKNKVSVSYYEGIEGVEEMYKKMFKLMRGKEYVGFFAHTKETPLELDKLFDELNEKHKKLKVMRKGITVNHKSLKKYFDKNWQKRYGVNLRTLPVSRYDSNISIEIFKNYTQIFSHRYLQGIVIDNPDIAKILKQIFQIVWEDSAKKNN